MGENADQERAQQTYEKSIKIEEQFGELFTSKKEKIMIWYKINIYILVTIQEETLSDVYDRICEIIDREALVHHAWLPSKEKL